MYKSGRRKGFSQSFVLFFTLMLLISLLSGESNAQLKTEPGNIKLGPFYVSPSLLVKEIYTDNLFFEKSNTKDDYKTVFSPGLKILLKPLNRHSILFAYEGIFTRHAEYNSEDTDDHRADGLIELDFKGGLNLKAWDTYTKAHEPRSYSPTGKIVKFETNVAAASASYELSKRFKIKAEYSNSNINFSDAENNFRDRKEDFASGIVFYRFLPKTSALIEYDFTRVKYDTNTAYDSDVNSVLAGVTWEVTDKITSTVKAGYLKKDFDSPSRNDFKGGIFAVDIDHQFTEFTSVKLVAQKKINETNILGTDTDYFTTTGTFGEFKHRFTGKISGLVNGSYGVDKYNKAITIGTKTEIREDKTWNAGAGLRYLIQKWWEIGLNYLHCDRNSNFDDFDYKENTYSLFVKFVF